MDVYILKSNRELFMWDLSDGRCLQANKIESMGAITGLLLNSTSKILICCGQSNSITLIDPSCLYILKQIDIVGDWINDFIMIPTDSFGVDRVISCLMDGSIKEFLFDESKLELSKVQSIGHAPDAFQIQCNLLDKRMILVLQKQFACVYLLESTGSLRTLIKFESLSTSPPSSTSTPSSTSFSPWKGGKFTTLRTLLLWNQNGSCFMYYLGSEMDLEMGSISNTSHESTILFSNGLQGIWTRQDLKIRDVQSCRQSVLLGEFIPCVSSDLNCICHVPMDQSLSQCAQHLLYFFNENSIGNSNENSNEIGNQKENQKLSIYTFWSGHISHSLTLQNSISTLNSLEKNQIQIKESFKHNFYSFWNQRDRNWNCACLVLKKYVAIGTRSGSIHLLSFSTLFSPKECDLEKDSIFKFQLHSTPITSLYATEYKQLEHSKLLLAGTQDGWVIILDLISKQSLSFICHSCPVLGFVGFVHSQEPKYKTWVASIAQDHSISIFDLEDKNLLYRFYGHLFDISKIYLKPNDGILIISCIDGKAFVWQVSISFYIWLLTNNDENSCLQDI